ncbi:MAG: transglutaminase family protein [Pseudomonadota bacterium]
MLLTIKHTTRYRFAAETRYGLKQIRVMPKDRDSQKVLSWELTLTGARREVEFEDQHHNHVILASIDERADEVTIESAGQIETTDTAGVVGQHGGFAPLWYFRRSTPLTRAGRGVTQLAAQLGDYDDDVNRMHALSELVRETVRYEIGATQVDTAAEQALEGEAGVCQDHAHIMIAAARRLGFPARYVSGYLMMDDRIDQEASHAWVEVHVGALGWVGYDVSNGISPDERYVRVATGLDYIEAAPISGVRISDPLHVNDGDDVDTILVNLAVQQ